MSQYLIKTSEAQKARLALSAAQEFQHRKEEVSSSVYPVLMYTEARKKLLCTQLRKQLKQGNKAFIYMEQKLAEASVAEQADAFPKGISALSAPQSSDRRTASFPGQRRMRRHRKSFYK